MNKERYLKILSKILKEYYTEIKFKNSVSEERKKYIEGYLDAAEALNAFRQKEIRDVIDGIHFKSFGKTIEERRKSEASESPSNNDFLEIPTFIREGISLKKK